MVTFKFLAAVFQIFKRFGILLPLSLSVGTRQKFGTKGLDKSSFFPYSNDEIAPVVLQIFTENPFPVTRILFFVSLYSTAENFEISTFEAILVGNGILN